MGVLGVWWRQCEYSWSDGHSRRSVGLIEFATSRFGGLCKINFNLYESTGVPTNLITALVKHLALHHTLYDVEYILYHKFIKSLSRSCFSPVLSNDLIYDENMIIMNIYISWHHLFQIVTKIHFMAQYSHYYHIKIYILTLLAMGGGYYSPDVRNMHF